MMILTKQETKNKLKRTFNPKNREFWTIFVFSCWFFIVILATATFSRLLYVETGMVIWIVIGLTFSLVVMELTLWALKKEMKKKTKEKIYD